MTSCITETETVS